MGAQIIVREATCQDIPAIVGLWEELLEKHPPALVETDYGHILDMMVTADSRRTGVGEKMVRALRDRFRSKGVHRIEVRRLISNEIASRFWAKMGFEPYLETLFVTC